MTFDPHTGARTFTAAEMRAAEGLFVEAAKLIALSSPAHGATITATLTFETADRTALMLHQAAEAEDRLERLEATLLLGSVDTVIWKRKLLNQFCPGWSDRLEKGRT